MIEKKRQKGRRIWEFHPSSICRILGLTYSGDELAELCKDLKLERRDASSYELHQQLCQLCRMQSQHARRVERLLEKQFAPYRNRVEGLSADEICEIIEGKSKSSSNSSNNGGTAAPPLNDVPLPALVWFALRNGDDSRGREIESRIASALHLLEHRALRLYDELARLRTSPGVRIAMPEELTKELRTAMNSIERLQRRCDRLEHKRDELLREREALMGEKMELVHELEELRRLNERLERQSQNQNQREVAVVKAESVSATTTTTTTPQAEKKPKVKVKRKDKSISSSASTSTPTPTSTPIPAPAYGSTTACGRARASGELMGLRVAYIGGVESLRLSYKEVVESFGCLFCYHCGHCLKGKKEIEGIVEKSDLIFCPVDINSHNACRMVKEACKLRNKPCYFLRSSGLSALRKVLSGCPLSTSIS